jgi:hypothetical protein
MQPQKTAVVCIHQPAKMKSILSRSTLQGANFTSVRMLIEAIEAFVASWNQNAAPFEWTKAVTHNFPRPPTFPAPIIPILILFYSPMVPLDARNP